ncbi:MAG: hypothetical protein KF708_05915 [Pirellulales bacterium]|nr:hypothetical protein [Pirellulales bacterium]
MVAPFDYIEGVIAAYRQAAEANRRTPGREGNVVVITPEMADDVLVTADLHGHRRNFNAIRKLADLDNHPRRHLIMQEVCHGGPTYPENGGCMSHSMLEDVAKLKAKYPDRVHFILSNHELAEMTEYPILKAKKMLNLLFRMGMQVMYGPAVDKVREAMVAFLKSCPLAVRLPGDVVVCHTLPEQVDRKGFDTSILEKQLEAIDFREHGRVFELVWGRDFRRENAVAFAQAISANVLIHGHEPCPNGFDVPNDVQVILDCTGDKATCLLLPTDRTYTHGEIVGRLARLT